MIQDLESQKSSEEALQIMEGQWWLGKFEGYGRLFDEKGNAYVGMFSEGKKHGNGRYFFANGDFYEGQMVDNRLHGHGSYFCEKSGETFVGEWDHGKITADFESAYLIDQKGTFIEKDCYKKSHLFKFLKSI